MPRGEDILRNLLYNEFKPGVPSSFPTLDLGNLKDAGVYPEVVKTYKVLGGRLNDVPIKFGKWDILLEDFIVEFDEEQHFNRYRQMTFNSLIYHIKPHFDLPKFHLYCDKYEYECFRKAKRGGYWTSPSTEKQFGKPAPNGLLAGNGSPRWRQRAFYDYLRDIYSIIYKVPVVRISVWDEIFYNSKNCRLIEIFNRGDSIVLEHIVNLISQRTRI